MSDITWYSTDLAPADVPIDSERPVLLAVKLGNQAGNPDGRISVVFGCYCNKMYTDYDDHMRHGFYWYSEHQYYDPCPEEINGDIIAWAGMPVFLPTEEVTKRWALEAMEETYERLQAQKDELVRQQKELADDICALKYPGYHTVKEVAEHFHVSTASVYRAIKQGKVVAYKKDGKMVVDSTELNRFSKEENFKV